MPDVPGPAPARIERATLDLQGQPGISGATRLDDGSIMAVSERSGALVHLDATGARLLEVLQIEGLDGGADLESMANLGGGLLLLGTERDRAFRGEDDLFEVQVTAGAARVTGRRSVSYQSWKLFAPGNKGIEALCASGGYIVAGVEAIVEEGGARLAPVAVSAVQSASWVPYDLMLTTATGKLSALDCSVSASGAQLDVVAIERHFGVARILSFNLPLPAPAEAHPHTRIEPVVLADLAVGAGELPNFESIVRLDDGRFWLFADNDYGGVRGPADLWRVEAAAPLP